MKSAIFLAAAGFLQANAYFILQTPRLTVERIDPIISPGIVSTHVHNLVGASNVNPNSTYDSLRESKCTSTPITVDLSSYWQPQLYHYDPVNETYAAISSYSKLYYLQRPGPKNETIHAFPAGLKMLAGSPYRRTYNASSFADQAINYVCQDYYESHQGDPEWEDRPNFFNHNCPDGMRAQVFFPSCWDGVNLYKDDQSHMAYPIQNVNTGDCPASHPVHLISLFHEFVYDVAAFPFNGNGSVTWVWANGDATGYGLHADFMNGWDIDVLQAAVDQCTGQIGGDLEDCPPLVPYYDPAAGSACKLEAPIVDEDVGLTSPIKSLPGCNPLWTGLGAKPTCDTPDVLPGFTTAASKPATGYASAGCIAEGTSGRALTGKSMTATNMTAAICTSFCASGNFEYSGTEYGSECYCGSSFANGASNATIAEELCGTACAGNENENCGGSRTLSLYQNPTYHVNAAPTLPKGWKSYGCIADSATSSRTLSAFSTASNNMTIDSCVATCAAKGYSYSGLEYSRECYCDNTLHRNTTSSACSMSCSGDERYICGGSAALSVFTNTQAAAPGYSYAGCVQEGTTGRLLTGASTTSDAMTIQSCTAFCSSKSLQYAGVEYGRECYCGSTFVNGGSGTNIEDSKCSIPCSGDSGSMCGGYSTLSLFSNPSLAPATSSLPNGWSPLGCMADLQNSTRNLAAYSFTSSNMTYTTCIQGCANRGYKLAGVEYSSECYCSNAFAYNATSAQCSMPCSGANNYICGGPNALTTFSSASQASLAKRDGKTVHKREVAFGKHSH